MFKTALFDFLPKYPGVNSGKIVQEGPDFDISSLLDFAMVIHFAAFSSFMSWYSIKYAPIIFISFLLGLDTKITFLLQLEQKLWNIYLNTMKLVAIFDFYLFLSFNTNNNDLTCCLMCLSDSLTKKI